MASSEIFLVPKAPAKTRFRKIMGYILRKIAANDGVDLCDSPTLADASVPDALMRERGTREELSRPVEARAS